MKNVMYAGLFLLGTLTFSSCDSKTSDSSGTVVEKDTVETEYKVEEKVVETDTTTRTTTIEKDSTK